VTSPGPASGGAWRTQARLAARVEGIGLVGPGLTGRRQAWDVLQGRVPYAYAPTTIPAADALPAVERRRASRPVRIALAAGLEAAAEAGRAASDFAAVFASSGGDGDNVHVICEMLASDDREISPTRFHNSVHNAPSGYWGIATGSQRAADSLAASDASFCAGFVEALSRLAADPDEPVLLIAYDVPYPEPLNAKRPSPDAFGVAFALFSPTSGGNGIAVTLESRQAPPDVLDDPGLERVRRGNRAARSLPLLVLLARGRAGCVNLEHVDGTALTACTT
jgi:hypothetical protein